MPPVSDWQEIRQETSRREHMGAHMGWQENPRAAAWCPGWAEISTQVPVTKDHRCTASPASENSRTRTQTWEGKKTLQTPPIEERTSHGDGAAGRVWPRTHSPLALREPDLPALHLPFQCLVWDISEIIFFFPDFFLFHLITAGVATGTERQQVDLNPQRPQLT